MLNNFIYAKQKSLFEEKLANQEVPTRAIVFIEDTKEIWNHGTYFNCSIVAEDSTDELEDVNTTNYVEYVAQHLTEEQKRQTRENIGAVSESYVNSLIVNTLNTSV